MSAGHPDSGHQGSAKITVPDIIAMKRRGEKIACLTAYDMLMSKHLGESGVDLILVGDSAGMVVAGHQSTIPVTIDQIVYHTRAVSRGNPPSLVVSDMPFLSYQVSVEKAVENAGRCLQEGRASAVKLEGGAWLVETVSHLVNIGIPVMGHLGLTPQSINALGGHKIQGRDPKVAELLLKDAQLLEEAGIFSLVLEMVPAELAKRVTERLSIPTIGIGAGPHCDGQILVTHDMLGYFDQFHPKFVRKYANLAESMREAYRQYIQDVKQGSFPSKDESF